MTDLTPLSLANIASEHQKHPVASVASSVLFLLLLLIFLCRNKAYRQGINTFPGVLGCQMFSDKLMAQMSSAFCTLYFCPHSIGIWNPFYRIGKTFIKARPATSSIELAF